MQRSSVLLPAPLGPMIAIFSPMETSTLTPRSTSWSPYCLCRSTTRTIGGPERPLPGITESSPLVPSQEPSRAMAFVSGVLDVPRCHAVTDRSDVQAGLRERREQLVVRDRRGHDHDLVHALDAALALVVVVEERDPVGANLPHVVMRRELNALAEDPAIQRHRV